MASSPQSNLCSRTIGLKPRFGTGKSGKSNSIRWDLTRPSFSATRLGELPSGVWSFILSGRVSTAVLPSVSGQRRIERQRGLVEDLILILLRQEIEGLAGHGDECRQRRLGGREVGTPAHPARAELTDR